MASPSVVPPVQASPKFLNILFATDFSPCSEAALPYARAIAERYGSTIHLVHVYSAEPLVGPLGVPIEDVEIERTAAQTRMDRFCECEALHHTLHTVTLEKGVVSEVISQLVGDLGIDLIVLGTHGRRGVRHFVLGSVAEQIFRHATCPVMTVGPEVHNGLSAGKIRAILYATDFSSGSRHAFAYALSLAKSAKAKLILLHAIENELLISFGDQAFSIVKSRLGQLMPEDGVDYSVVAECGAATDMILKTAKDVGADLIVMGARKGAAASAHSPWATAHRVVCYAACPVLTVRE